MEVIGASGGARRREAPEGARRGTRPVWFGGAWHETAILSRLDLPVGAVVPGPAILEQPDATTVVDPGLSARVDRLGNVIITGAAFRDTGAAFRKESAP